MPVLCTVGRDGRPAAAAMLPTALRNRRGGDAVFDTLEFVIFQGIMLDIFSRQ